MSSAGSRAPEDQVAGAVAACGLIGTLPGLLAAAWWTAHASPLTEAHFIVAYFTVAVCTGVASMLFMFVSETQAAMRAIPVSAHEVAFGTYVGLLVGSALVAVAWAVGGFRSLYLFAPMMECGLGAALAARRLLPFGPRG